MKKQLKLMELVILAMIAVVMGIVFTGLDAIYTPITTATGPLGGAALYGVYLISALIPMAIIRKPGAALIGSLFTGIVNLLMGSPYGINIIVAALLQGLGVEISMMIWKYNRFDLVALGLGGIFASILVMIRDWFVFGLSQMGSLLPAIIIIRLISAFIIGGGLALLVAKALRKTGVLKALEKNNR